MAVFAAALTLLACGSESLEVRGTILEVDSASIVDLRSLDVQDGSGAKWHFEARRRFVEFTPSHLRQHMVQGLSVTVLYHVEDDTLVIDDITD